MQSREWVVFRIFHAVSGVGGIFDSSPVRIDGRPPEAARTWFEWSLEAGENLRAGVAMEKSRRLEKRLISRLPKRLVEQL